MGTGHFQEFEDEYLETLYDFHEKFPGQRVRNGDLAKYLDVSPASATEMVQRLVKNGFVEHNLKHAEVEKAYQFEREGYFCRDRTDNGLVFNKTVGLRDTWNQ